MALASVKTRVFRTAYDLANFVQTELTVVQILQIVAGASGEITLIYATGVTPLAGKQSGSAVFVAATVVDIAFAAPMVDTNYSIGLSGSLDTGDASIPSYGWSLKSVNGFRITVATAFTGSVDWAAQAY